MKELSISSQAFSEGGWIPNEHSGRGIDISPELILKGICEKAVSLAITLDDNSHPIFPNFNHWVIWNIPVQKVIPKGIAHGKSVPVLKNASQGIAYGIHRYKGPKPPFKSIHTYTFTVYVLDCELSLSPDSRKRDLLRCMEEHILQKAALSGRFQSHRKE